VVDPEANARNVRVGGAAVHGRPDRSRNARAIETVRPAFDLDKAVRRAADRHNGTAQLYRDAGHIWSGTMPFARQAFRA